MPRASALSVEAQTSSKANRTWGAVLLPVGIAGLAFGGALTIWAAKTKDEEASPGPSYQSAIGVMVGGAVLTVLGGWLLSKRTTVVLQPVPFAS